MAEDRGIASKLAGVAFGGKKTELLLFQVTGRDASLPHSRLASLTPATRRC
jgi:hypothetical protein